MTCVKLISKISGRKKHVSRNLIESNKNVLVYYQSNLNSTFN